MAAALKIDQFSLTEGGECDTRNEFRHLQFNEVPPLLSFKTGDNPFKDKKNVLTGRQVKKRQRLIKRFK